MDILQKSPFAQLDALGVGKLVQEAIKSSRAANPEIKIGICGEHGGDPTSIRFLANSGVNYVSCSLLVFQSHVWFALRSHLNNQYLPMRYRPTSRVCSTHGMESAIYRKGQGCN